MTSDFVSSSVSPALPGAVRLRPHHPVLRRAADALQIGVLADDAVEVARLSQPLLRLLLELDGAWRLDRLLARARELGADLADARALLFDLYAAGVLVDAGMQARVAEARRSACVLVTGAGPLLPEVASGLAVAGVRRVHVAEDGADADLGADGGLGGGGRVGTATRGRRTNDGHTGAGGDPVGGGRADGAVGGRPANGGDAGADAVADGDRHGRAGGAGVGAPASNGGAPSETDAETDAAPHRSRRDGVEHGAHRGTRAGPGGRGRGGAARKKGASAGLRYTAAAEEAVRRVAPDVRFGIGPPRTRPDLVVLAGRLRPDQEQHAALARRGVPQLVVRVTDGVGLVGPLVLPGRSGCLRCGDLHRAERDPRWATVAADLAGMIGSAGQTTTVATAALAAEQAVLVLDSLVAGGRPPPTLGAVLELDPRGGELRRHGWPPHQRCECGASRAWAYQPPEPASSGQVPGGVGQCR